MKYRQITSGERYAIGALRRRGLSARAIAAELGRAHTTISRELRRNLSSQGRYTPFKANQKCRGRRTRSRRNARITPETWAIAERYLRLDWSPEQVSGFLRVEGILQVSHESIYVHVWHDKTRSGDLWTHLRQATKKRRKRYGAYDSRGRVAGKRHISERPHEVEDRRELGHWEIDTVMGNEHGRNSVLTLVERATGYTVMGKLQRHCAADANARRWHQFITRRSEAPDARLTRLLRHWSKDCPSDTMVFPATHIVAQGPDKDHMTLVRVAKDGQRMSVDSFREKTWKPALAKVGLEGTRLHDMRHAYIQWLVALNVNPLIISAAAGHQDPRTTANYLSRDPKLLQGVRDAFNAPRKTRRGAKAPEDAEFVYPAKEPAKKKAEKPEKPAHIPGSGPALKRGLPKKNR